MVRIEATLKPRQMEKPLRLPLPKERASVSGRRRLYRHQEPKGLANGGGWVGAQSGGLIISSLSFCSLFLLRM